MIPDYLVISIKFAWQGPWNIGLYSSHLHICLSLETKQTVKRKIVKGKQIQIPRHEPVLHRRKIHNETIAVENTVEYIEHSYLRIK